MVWCSSALLLVGETRLTWWLGVVSLGVFSSAGLPVPLGVVLRVGGPVLWSHVVEGVGWGGVDSPFWSAGWVRDVECLEKGLRLVLRMCPLGV